MDRSRKSSRPADVQDPNHPPTNVQASPPAREPSPKRLPSERRGSSENEGRMTMRGQMLHGQDRKEIVPPPFSGGYQPNFCDHASFLRSLEEREIRREEKIVKLKENLSKITDKLTVAKRNMATLKKDKKVMEISHNAVLRMTVGNIKKKFVKGFKKWVDKKNNEFMFYLQYSEMKFRLKLIKSYNAGKLDLTSEETKLRLGVALLTGSFLDDSDVDPSFSDDDAGPNGTAHEPDADSPDDELDE